MMKTVLLTVVAFAFSAIASAADMKTVTISNSAATVMTISVPQAAKVTTDKEKTVIDTKEMNLYLWVVPKAKTVDAPSPA